MKVYRGETAPLLDYYADQLQTVEAVGSVDEVFARPCARRSKPAHGVAARSAQPQVVAQRTPGELDAMAVAECAGARALQAVRDAAAQGLYAASSTGSPRPSSATAVAPRPSWAITATRPRSAPRSTTAWCATSVGRRGPGVRRPGLHRLWRHRRRLARRFGRHIRDRRPDPADEILSCATRESMEAGIAAMVPGNRLTDVSRPSNWAPAPPSRRHGRKFGIVAGYGGHGIGREMHMDPSWPMRAHPGAARCWPSARCSRSNRC